MITCTTTSNVLALEAYIENGFGVVPVHVPLKSPLGTGVLYEVYEVSFYGKGAPQMRATIEAYHYFGHFVL